MKIKELIIKSIKENSFDKLLLGDEEYRCEVSEFVATEVPTDWPNIVRTIYVVYKEMPELMIDKKFEEAINDLSERGYLELYCVAMIVFFQIINEEKHSAPFRIKRTIVEKLSEKLLCFKEDLKTCYKWTGKKYKDGLWGDIKRINSIFYEDYGITIIKIDEDDKN